MNTNLATSNEQALEVARMELDSQVVTAKQYPRDLELFKKNCIEMVTFSPEVAAKCNYSLSKGNKIITGPSIRLAEVIQGMWGNLRVGGRITGNDETWVYAQCFCNDLESNNRMDLEVKRRITNKQGKTYPVDMIQTTGQAAIAIGIRNCIFKVIPKIYVEQFSEMAKIASVGKADSFSETVKKAIDHFQTQYGISEDRIMQKLEIKDKRSWKSEHVQTLHGIATALRDGMTQIENEFPEPMREPEGNDPDDGSEY